MARLSVAWLLAMLADFETSLMRLESTAEIATYERKRTQSQLAGKHEMG
jgi:hypothetical protein